MFSISGPINSASLRVHGEQSVIEGKPTEAKARNKILQSQSELKRDHNAIGSGQFHRNKFIPTRKRDRKRSASFRFKMPKSEQLDDRLIGIFQCITIFSVHRISSTCQSNFHLFGNCCCKFNSSTY